MNFVSVFDGMACGYIAAQEAGIKIDRYVAFEIDKYAVQTSSHNFPNIEHRGDVFEADFTEFRGFDFLVGGSPCTYWSVAKKDNRETEASGMGWELFSQYVRALHEVQPMYFIYENNKSMSKAIRESITETFGFEPIFINSSLVSAQNRQRLYWVGKRNPDGTYSRIHVEQPEDRGVLLKDVLDRSEETVIPNCYELDPDSLAKYITSTSSRIGRVAADDKNKKHDSQQYRVYSTNGKSVTLCSSPGSLGKMTGLYAIKVPCLCDEGYEVNGGRITIKGNTYPIKLEDGYYIIRNLTVGECKRLQTVPKWYEFPVSDTQARKMLGNGWTVQVIVHLINATQAGVEEEYQLNIFEMV